MDGVSAAGAGTEAKPWEEFYNKLDFDEQVAAGNWPVPMDDPWARIMEPGEDRKELASRGILEVDDPWINEWGWGKVGASVVPQPTVGQGNPCSLQNQTFPATWAAINNPKSKPSGFTDAWIKCVEKKSHKKDASVINQDLLSFVDELAHAQWISPERKDLLDQFCVVGILIEVSIH